MSTTAAASERPPQTERWLIGLDGLSLSIRRPGQPVAVSFDLEVEQALELIHGLASSLFIAGHASGLARGQLGQLRGAADE